MTYQLVNIKDNVSGDIADCIYDFNYMLPNPYAAPVDGNWHDLDDAIEKELLTLGYKVIEGETKDIDDKSEDYAADMSEQFNEGE